MPEVKVSIVCLVYNHEEYLREALEGFVSQRTNFRFEALVHDDASTDNSAAIIREYEQKYPDIIKPIYQKENQYSKGRKINSEILLPRAKGEYVAFCEGDDCWVDPLKLQKQYDLMEKHKEVDVCAHNAKIVGNAGFIKETMLVKKDVELISLGEVIVRTRGGLPTASLMIRRNVFESPIYKRVIGSCGGAHMMTILASLRNGLLCLSDVMSVYHTGVKGSWTERNKQSKNKMVISHYYKQREAFRLLNELTEHKYEKELELGICYLTYNLLCLENRCVEIIKNRTMYNNLGNLQKLEVWTRLLHLKWLIPFLHMMLPRQFRVYIKRILRIA